jgi:hypothetical protein
MIFNFSLMCVFFPFRFLFNRGGGEVEVGGGALEEVRGGRRYVNRLPGRAGTHTC